MGKEEQITAWIEDILTETDCFIVSAKLGADANYKFFIDSDTGFSLEKSVKINRALRHQIDESGLFPNGNYSLEISSPGIDEPLKLLRQYKKNIGRLLNVQTAEEEQHEGRLTEINENQITLEVKKKKTTEMINIQLNNIEKATVQVEFK